MSDTKKFLELVASDENVKKELEKASLKALVALIAEKGLTAEAEKALAGARAKVAEAHGLNIGGMEELDPEELEAVAGGACRVNLMVISQCSFDMFQCSGTILM